jgi:hypothetical protein
LIDFLNQSESSVSFGEHVLRNESLRRQAQARFAAFFPKGRMENDPDAEQSVSALVTSSPLSVKNVGCFCPR